MLINMWQQLNKNSKGIDYVLANITNVETCSLGMVIDIRFKNRLGKTDKSRLVISYDNPDGCYRIAENGKIHPFYTDNNTTYVIDNTRMSAETLVLLGQIFLSGTVLRNSFQGMCADVIDGSGTKKAREAFGLKYNIRPSNLQMTTKIDNFKKGQHQNIV